MNEYKLAQYSSTELPPNEPVCIGKFNSIVRTVEEIDIYRREFLRTETTPAGIVVVERLQSNT